MNISESYIDDLLKPEDDRAWKLAVGHILKEQLEEARKTNGRLLRVEDWRTRMEMQESIKKAVDEANANTLISKSQWKRFIAILVGFGAVVGTVSQFVKPILDRVLG